jgi:multidrug efflux system membrane fusion protein
VVVPTAAVQTGRNGPQIFVVKSDRTVDLRLVKVLRSAGDISLIGAGLRAGETVVTDGQLQLVPGARVEAKTLSAGVPAGAKTAATP